MNDLIKLAARESQHQEQPRPKPGAVDVLDAISSGSVRVPGLEAWTVHEMAERVAIGEKRYGSRLMTHNGRNALRDAREEALDGLLYSAQGLIEDEENREHYRSAAGCFAAALDALHRIRN